MKKQQYKIIIAGGRDFNDYTLLTKVCNEAIPRMAGDSTPVIISGGAAGADSLGEQYAQENGIAIERHPADWKKHGKAAGPIRNAEMAACADFLIAFWDGKSRGTQNMMMNAVKKDIPCIVVTYNTSDTLNSNIKKRIEMLGEHFNEKTSRDELYTLIHKFINDKKKKFH